MEFELTQELTDEIIFAMEDQTGHFLFDSAEGRCVASRESGAVEDDDRYYAIPLWDSVSGFRMRERFVAQLRNPIMREDLRGALASGHGVFRKFKDILKGSPEIERLWFLFKEREMRLLVLEWYNGLRDFWGLERVGAEPEETEEIVSQDFSFRERAGEDGEAFEEIEALLSSVEGEIARENPLELSEAIGEIAARIRGDDDGAEWTLAAETADGDIAGVARSAPVPEGSFLSAQITAVAVYPEFRGLGLGKELLARTVAHWRDRGYRWLVFAIPVVPPAFRPALHRAGFVERGHVSVIDLAGSPWH
jgi:GNAT superfamily N-acetyltransferase